MSDHNPHRRSEELDLGGHVPKRRSAFSRARSRSLLNTALMVIMPLIFIGTIGYFLYEAGTFEEFGAQNTSSPKPAAEKIAAVKASENVASKKTVTPLTQSAKPAPKPETPSRTIAAPSAEPKKPEAVLDVIVSDKIKMVAPKITRFDKKSRTYIVEAASAERDEKQPDIVFLKKVKSEIRLPLNSQKVFVTANEGTYNKQTEELDLAGQINVTATNGYRATLSSAHVTLKNGHISSNQPVIVYMPQGSIAANGVEMLDGGATIRFLNRARMDIDGSGAKK